MIKKKKWLSICLVVCLIGGIGGAAWYRQKKIEERRMSLVYIPKVEDSTNDFWKALILGTKMPILRSKHRQRKMILSGRMNF